MATEITVGAENVLDDMKRTVDQSLPVEDRFDPGFVDHDPADGQPPGAVGLAWYWEHFGTSFSDVERRTIETIATPGHLITVQDLSGTHTGEWMGHSPTEKRFTVRSIQVIALKDGRPVERWGSTDQLGIMQQLGLL